MVNSTNISISLLYFGLNKCRVGEQKKHYKSYYSKTIAFHKVKLSKVKFNKLADLAMFFFFFFFDVFKTQILSAQIIETLIIL